MIFGTSEEQAAQTQGSGAGHGSDRHCSRRLLTQGHVANSTLRT